MISHKKKFVFIHINRTGGSSVDKSLAKYASSPFKRHQMMSEVETILGTRNITNYFKFTIVRNPWDRLLSKYCWSIQCTKSIPKNLTFDYYVRHIKYFERQERRARYNAFQPQVKWLKRKNGCVAVNFVLKFENLQDDWVDLCGRLDLRGRNLPHLKKTNREHYTRYYTEELIDVVCRKYKEDIDRFEYRFND